MALNRWGFEAVAWQTAKEEGKRLLASYARRRRTIPYSEFVRKIGAIHLEPNDPRLHHFLDEISTEEHSENRGLLSALVVHKLGDAQPGPGFLNWLVSLAISLKISNNSGFKKSNMYLKSGQHQPVDGGAFLQVEIERSGVETVTKSQSKIFL